MALVPRLLAFSDLPVSPHSIVQNAFASSYGDTDSILTAFQGDLSNVAYSTGKTLGTAAIKSPVLNYENFPENSVNFVYFYNPPGSGFNLSLSGNGNRTGVSAYFTKVDNYGNGDMFAYFAEGFVDGANPGALNFLSNPAITLYAGSVSSAAAGTYLNPVEIDTKDNGFDVAAINYVGNASRSNDTGALGAVWYLFRGQSVGTKAIDAIFSGVGLAKIGIDLAGFTSNASGTWTNAAMTLKGNDRVYFNATPGTGTNYSPNTGTTYLYYSTSNSGLQAVVGNSPAFLLTASAAFLYASSITLGQNSNNHLVVTGAATGSAPAISVAASVDTNQDFKLAPLGTGNVEFANAGSFSANGAVATALGSIGPTGSHTTVQEWLTIKDASGVVRYIPCF